MHLIHAPGVTRTLLQRAPGLMLTIFLLINLTSAWNLTLTYDEPEHLRYGKQILALNSDRFDDSKMPFSALNALPGRLAEYLPGGWLHSALGATITARLATVLFSALVGVLVFRWARELYGEVPALFALFFYVFEPNITAHSQLITTDIYATGMALASLFTFWRFCLYRDWKHLFYFGLTLGLAQLAKYTSVFLYPLLPLMLLAYDAPDLKVWIERRDGASLKRYLYRTFLFALTAGLISLLVINAGFLFNRTLTPLGSYRFRSQLFAENQARLRALKDFPVPLPYPYLEGLDYVLYRERTGQGYGNIYLLGELSAAGFNNYYLIVFLYKVPIPLHLALLLSLLLFFTGNKKRSFRQRELFLLAPAVYLFAYFNFFNRAQLGVRFLLVIFPFLILFCAGLLQGWQRFGRRHWLVISGLAGYLMITSLSYFPHYIPYFNELVPDRRQAYKILADSNLDWGQVGWYISQYRELHPDTIIDPPLPTAGRVVVSANNLVGITAKPETFRWLRENFEPVDTVAYAYLVYEIDPEQLRNVVDRSSP